MKLERILIPTCLLGDVGWPTVVADPSGLALFTIDYDEDGISSVQPAFGEVEGLLISAPADIHTHIDKTYVGDITGPADGDLFSAIERMRSCMEDSTSEEIQTRMERALQAAYSMGTRAMRTHLDWGTEKAPRSVTVFKTMREMWLGRVDLQGVSLTSLDTLADPKKGDAIAQAVAKAGLILGCFVYRNSDLTRKLQAVFDLAKRYHLDLDFHVDEGLDQDAVGLWAIASLKSVNNFSGIVVCGHACSLSIQEDQQAIDTLRACFEANVHLVSLPTTNLYLQGDWQGTPIERGLTRIREAKMVGLPVSIATDNVQDAFYPYGDYDLLSAFATGVLAAHLSPPHQWLDAICVHPARAMKLSWDGLVTPGCPADFVVLNARRGVELMTDSGRRRDVIRGGVLVHSTRV